MDSKLIDSYTAGLFDGEGTVTMYTQKVMKYRAPQLSMVSTSFEFLHFLVKNYGGRIANKGRNKPTDKLKAQWVMTGSAKVIDFLKRIRPYMLDPEKIRRADLLITQYLTHKSKMNTSEYDKLKIKFELEFFKNSKHPSIREYLDNLKMKLSKISL